MILQGCLRLTISCSLNCAWEMEVTTKLGLCKLNLELIIEEETSANLPLNVRIILSDPLSDGSSFYVSCVYNHCHSKNLNCRSMMGLTSQFSCFYDSFSFYCVSYSLMTILSMIYLMMSLMMMVLGPGYLVRALFHFLKIPLVVSVDYFHLVESLEYFHLVESLEYFHLVESTEYFHLIESNLAKSNIVKSNLVESI